MPEADILLGNEDKLQAKSWHDLAQGRLPAKQVSDIMQVREVASHLTGSFDDHTRGFCKFSRDAIIVVLFVLFPMGGGRLVHLRLMML
jgi:threonylcarbamoyladenosine tRNA methylthiotransferase MtaB